MEENKEEMKNATEQQETEEAVVETMDMYRNELEQSFRTLREGDIVNGTIIEVAEEAIYVDLKYYAQGIIPVNEITDDPSFLAKEHYKTGDEISATIIRMDDGQGNLVLSMKEANQVLSWEKLLQYQKEETVLKVKVSDIVNAGVIAYAEGIRGFIPASQLALDYVEELDSYLGRELAVVVMNVEEEKEKLVMSAKSVLLKHKEEEHRSKVAGLVPGSIFEGTVESIMPYGAFVNLGDGLTGLVHISRICQKRIKTPAEVLKVGEKVKVKLIDVKDGKLSLSMKEFEEILEAEPESTESFEYHEEGEASTSLGSLLAGLKL